MNIYEEIIKNEKFLIRDLRRDLENGVSPCVKCTESAIKYHEKIIECILELKLIKETMLK